MRDPFVRPQTSKKIRLTDRDLDILTYGHTLRLLTPKIVARLLDMSEKKARERLKDLWDDPNGYLDRPLVQKQLWDVYTPGSSPWVSAVSDPGARALAQARGVVVGKTNGDKRFKNKIYRSAGHFAHALAVPEAVSMLAAACRQQGRPFRDHCQLQGGDLRHDYRPRLTIPVVAEVRGRAVKKTVIPDYACGIPQALLLEVDRGTEQIKIKDSSHSESLGSKFLFYNQVHKQKIFPAKYGCDFHVLVITTTPTRRDNMIAYYQKQKRYTPWLFLFADQGLLATPDPLSYPVFKGNGRPTTLAELI